MGYITLMKKKTIMMNSIDKKKLTKLILDTNVCYKNANEKTPKRTYSSVLTNANNITAKYITPHMQTTVKTKYKVVRQN